MINFLKSLELQETTTVTQKPILTQNQTKITFGKRVSIYIPNQPVIQIVQPQPQKNKIQLKQPPTVPPTSSFRKPQQKLTSPRKQNFYTSQNYFIQKRQKQLQHLQKTLHSNGFPAEPKIDIHDIFNAFYSLSVNFHGEKCAIGGKIMLKVCRQFIKIKKNNTELDLYPVGPKTAIKKKNQIIRNLTFVEFKTREELYYKYMKLDFQVQNEVVLKALRDKRKARRKQKDREQLIQRMHEENLKIQKLNQIKKTL